MKICYWEIGGEINQWPCRKMGIRETKTAAEINQDKGPKN